MRPFGGVRVDSITHIERIVTCALVSCKWSSYLVPISRKRIEGQLVINHIVDFCVTLDGDVPQVSLIIT